MSRNREVFEAVWNHVNRSYYDSEFGGKDWTAIGKEYGSRLTEGADNGALRSLLEDMLNELGESHFNIVAGSFQAGERVKGWQGGDAGLELAQAGEGLVVFRISENGPAWRAGVRMGDRVESVNGVTFSGEVGKLESSGLPGYLISYTALHRVMGEFQGVAGERIEVVGTDPSGNRKQCVIVLEEYEGWVVPAFGHLGEMPIALESKMLPGDIAYLRFSLWYPVVMKELRAFVASLGAEVSGVVIDLRGNPGGIGAMAGGVAGMFVEQETVLGTTALREGHVNFVGYPQKNAFLGPVAILVDGASCSTSEIFAIGLQESGRARVFGQKSPGAALPSAFIRLPNGDLLQSVLGDFKTAEGARLETIGVVPDLIVSLKPIELALGKDSIIEAARDWILDRTLKNYEN